MGKKYTTDEIEVGGHMLDASMMTSLDTVVTNSSSYFTTSGGTLTGDLTVNGDGYSIAGWGVGTSDTPVGKIFNNSGVFHVRAETGRQIAFGNVTNGEAVRINATGNVGIGTTSPGQKLHVVGTSNFQGAVQVSGGTFVDSERRSIYLDSFAGGGGDGIFFRDGFSYNASITTEDHSGSSADGICISGFDGVSFSTGSNAKNERMRIDSSGNVGIGTTSPVSQLEVGDSESGGSGVTISSLYSSSNAYLNFRTGHPNNDLVWNTANIGATDDGNYNGQLNFRTSTSGRATPTTKMVIKATGNVGIGTTSPDNKLHVYGGRIVLDNALAAQSAMQFNHAGTEMGVIYRPGGASDQLRFFMTGAGDTMTLNSSGNVGIGTTSPSEKLEVAGNVKIGSTTTGLKLSESGDDFLVQGVDVVGNAWNSIHLQADSLAGLYIEKDTNNVGIGTTSPGAKLQVNGGIRAFGTTGQIDASPDFGAFRFYNGSTFRGGLGMGQWASVGNSTDIVQYLNNVNYYISNGTTALLKVDTNGNVGIGTTSPGAKLEVSGSNSLSIKLSRNNTDSTYTTTLTNNYDSTLGTELKSGDYNILTHGNSTGTSLNFTNGAMTFDFRDSEKMRITDGGNVGIGTTSPGSKLEISSTSDALLELNGGATANPYMMWSQAGVRRSYIQHVDSEDNLSLASEYGGMRFLTGTGGTETEKMRILANGNVGIGITSPTDMLDVNGTSLFRRDLTIYHKGNNSAPSYELRFEGTNSSGVDKVHASLESSPYATDTNAGTLLFKTANASNQILDTRMVIDGVGNVGIGTTNPGARLDVKDGSSAMRFQEYSNGASLFLDGADGDFIGGDYFNISAYGATDLAFGYGAFTKMVMKSTGNVGIGTTSPSARIHADYSGLAGKFVSSQATGLEVQGGGNGQPIARFKDTSAAEKVTISSTGNVGIGNTSPADELDVVGISRFTHSSSTSYRGAIETVVDNAYPTWDIGWLHARTGSSTYGNVARFNDQSGFQIGAITYNGSAGVSYATTSDYRLKENIEEISDSISRVKKLKPCRFNFTTEKNRVVDGFIAHEVQEVVPEAVHGEKDALQEDGSIDTQTLEVSRLIPVLTKALQEAIAKIEELELRIQTLENK